MAETPGRLGSGSSKSEPGETGRPVEKKRHPVTASHEAAVLSNASEFRFERSTHCGLHNGLSIRKSL